MPIRDLRCDLYSVNQFMLCNAQVKHSSNSIINTFYSKPLNVRTDRKVSPVTTALLTYGCIVTSNIIRNLRSCLDDTTTREMLPLTVVQCHKPFRYVYRSLSRISYMKGKHIFACSDESLRYSIKRTRSCFCVHAIPIWSSNIDDKKRYSKT